MVKYCPFSPLWVATLIFIVFLTWKNIFQVSKLHFFVAGQQVMQGKILVGLANLIVKHEMCFWFSKATLDFGKSGVAYVFTFTLCENHLFLWIFFSNFKRKHPLKQNQCYFCTLNPPLDVNLEQDRHQGNRSICDITKVKCQGNCGLKSSKEVIAF